MNMLRDGEVFFNVRVPVDLRRDVKRYAVDHDTTVEALVNELLVAKVAKEASEDTAVANRR